jgi:hypothetical protein
MALQLRHRVLEYQQSLNNLRERLTQSRTHHALFQRGDLEACPRILQERADELKIWLGDVGGSRRSQDGTSSTLADQCLDEISDNLDIIKSLFDQDAGGLEINNDQR